jgi:hypothetical protein
MENLSVQNQTGDLQQGQSGARNGFAIASFVLGFVGWIIPFLGNIIGIIFGALGIKSKHQTFSIIGIVFNSLSILIMPVVLVIAFNGILQNAQRKADVEQAKSIQQAIEMLIDKTGVADITRTGTFYNAPISSTTSEYTFGKDGYGSHLDVMELITALQDTIYVANPETGQMVGYGPYLINPAVVSEDASWTPSYDTYAPQWNPTNGGQHVGYEITIDFKTQTVSVIPAIDEYVKSLSQYKVSDNNQNSKIIVIT